MCYFYAILAYNNKLVIYKMGHILGQNNIPCYIELFMSSDL